jgi:hypothetical protein
MKINLKKLHAQNKIGRCMEKKIMLGANFSLGGTTRNHFKEWLKNQK